MKIICFNDRNKEILNFINTINQLPDEFYLYHYEDELIESLNSIGLKEIHTNDIKDILIKNRFNILFKKNKRCFLENKYMLYTIVKKRFSFDYIIGTVNTFEVYKNKRAASETKEDVIIKIINSYGGIVEKSEILDKT